MKYLVQFTPAEQAALLRRRQAYLDALNFLIESKGITEGKIAEDCSGIIQSE